ncbi:hypothetical protein [Streptomyces caniscabiei]|uniref:hypothetical protein n=1 Tax=Streptomyces caniscabiei TaxID=2746961 RepID=UPI000A36A544|nr:hypothetical protein [Streptomyces caniscabiei]
MLEGDTARWAMWAFVIVNVVVVEVLFLSAGSGKNEVLAARFVTTRHYADATPSRGNGSG